MRHFCLSPNTAANGEKNSNPGLEVSEDMGCEGGNLATQLSSPVYRGCCNLRPRISVSIFPSYVIAFLKIEHGGFFVFVFVFVLIHWAAEMADRPVAFTACSSAVQFSALSVESFTASFIFSSVWI